MNKRYHPLIIALIGILILVFLFSAWKVLFSSPHHGYEEESGQVPVSKTIVKDGVEYFPRQDITVMMLAGIDRSGKTEDSGAYTNNGKADMIALTVFDNTAKTYRILFLNRDTMVHMPSFGLGGAYLGTTFGQLALAHTYGSGLSDSSENLRTAVSGLLNGIKIDYYLSMNMDAIALLTDAVGGVSVAVTDDFSAVDPSIQKGTVTLSGAQAVHFIQGRGGIGDQMNVSRMERHKEYINGFITALNQKTQQSDRFMLKTYDSIAPYLVSNCTATTLNQQINRYGEFTFDGFVNLEGTNQKGEEYMEFYPDEQKLEDLILSLFYAKKNI